MHLDLQRVTAAVSLLAGIVEGSDDAIIAKDRDGIVIGWNPAAERLFGYDEDEIVGTHIGVLVPDSHRGEDVEVFERILAGRKVEHYTTQRLTKDGRLVDVAVTVSALRDASGEIVGASKIVRDVTERREALQMQAHLAAIIENSDDAIISKDREGVITSWNPAAERILGYSADEAIGQHISLIFPPDLIGRERDILGEILDGQKVDHYETRRRRRDGRVIDVALTVSPLRDADGTVIGASKILRDITDMKASRERELRSQELARANARLAAADRAKDEFLAVANHELRTPLTAIAGFTDTMLHRSVTPEQQREFLEIIDRQAARLTRLVDDLLGLTRARLMRAETAAEQLSLRESIERLLVDQARNDVKVQGDVAVVACIDPDHLRQIVLNLVDNATKYGGGDVEVCIRGARTHAVVSILDRGPGVPNELVPRLFDAFSRADVVRDAQLPGTGLGLSIVRSLARANNGSVWYERREGGGSAFHVRLPMPVDAVLDRELDRQQPSASIR
jgi:PAS domain S-box-containing protein